MGAIKMAKSPTPSEDLYNASPEPTNLQTPNVSHGNESTSPSPPASSSSDKENLSRPSDLGASKGLSTMPPPRRPVRISDTDDARKRKRTGERDAPRESNRWRETAGSQSEALDSEDSDGYNPDQDIEERRRLRKGLRELARDLNDNRAEYLHPSSTGLIDTLTKANEITSSVKQTADATIDSRLLVTAADLSYRKTVQLTLGDSDQGIDVDEFVSKCITYMRRADNFSQFGPRPLQNSQRQRGRRNVTGDSDDEGGDEGDMLNWDALGRLCLQGNSRPAISGFLLGPLSLEKRARKPTQRRAGLKNSNLRETRPEVLHPGDIEKAENSNLTVLCTRILNVLKRSQREGMEAVESEATDDMTSEQAQALLDKYGLHASGGVDLFRFVVNPHSFGQTVENLFYVSFLIRDGHAGINIDENGLPALEATEPRRGNEKIEKSASKHQAVLAIDMLEWKDLIEAFRITKPMIAHRVEEEQAQVGSRGWYS